MITVATSDVVDMYFTFKAFEKKFKISIFSCPDVEICIFYKKFGKKGGLRELRLNGSEGNTKFDFQVQVARFIPSFSNVIHIRVKLRGNVELFIVFLPKFFVLDRTCIFKVLVVDTKSGRVIHSRLCKIWPSDLNKIRDDYFAKPFSELFFDQWMGIKSEKANDRYERFLVWYN